ncbi:MAG: class II glutamine amidotransferase [Polyangiaceae bacterium]|nr:class II glutamine amidotransferase [Polyangiaceae bacterium]
MPNLLAMSFEGELSPAFDLLCLRPGRTPPDGWGLAHYPRGEPSAAVLKEYAPSRHDARAGRDGRPEGGERGERNALAGRAEGGERDERNELASRDRLAHAWDHTASSVFLLHVRAARWGSPSNANTQPFSRSWARRDWLFVHAGSLEQRLETAPDAPFEPIGSTDSEAIFCALLSRLAERRWRSLRELDAATLQSWFATLNQLGVLTCALTDGRDLALYADATGAQPLYLWQLKPPYDNAVVADHEIAVDLTRRGTKPRKGVIAATNPLAPEGRLQADWQPLAPGSLVLVRQGVIVTELAPPPRPSAPLFETPASPNAPASPASPAAGATSPPSAADAPSVPAPPAPTPSGMRPTAKPTPVRPRTATPRRLAVRHRTAYHYDRPVERSTHLLRLEPIHDRLQHLVSHRLSISVDGKWRDYEDVFGNRSRRVLLDTPFTDLVIDSVASVVTLDTDPLDARPLHARTSIPLNWMPWQRHMLQPYLLPPELPESQLIELHEYAMSFVERNDYDLIDSLLDMNLSLYKDYEYRQGATSVATTPFETYHRREGVCQDFTNLFLCLARLLNVPARYVCGYLYTGPKHENRAMAEATHAWAQVYLPESGWKGFDPTNGVLTQTDHVRVSVGRNYMDATPTSGTLFVGGGCETLDVSVSVEEEG